MVSIKQPKFSPEDIRKQVSKAKGHLDAVPLDYREAAEKALKHIDENAESYTTIGVFGIAKVWSITGLNPDYRAPKTGGDRDSLLGAITDIGDEMMHKEDRELAEAAAARKAALEMGLKIVQIVVPLLLAAI